MVLAPSADRTERRGPLDHLGGRARQAVLAQVVHVAPDRGGPTGQFGLVAADAQHLHHRQIQRPPGLCAGLSDPPELLLGVLHRRERHVELGGVGGGQPRGAGGGPSPDDQRQWRLGRPHDCRAVDQRVVLPGEGERRVRGPQPRDDGQLLLETVEALGQRAEPDGGRVAREAGEGYPGVGRTGQPIAAHGEVVVAAEERVEAALLGAQGNPQQVVVSGHRPPRPPRRTPPPGRRTPRAGSPSRILARPRPTAQAGKSSVAARTCDALV